MTHFDQTIIKWARLFPQLAKHLMGSIFRNQRISQTPTENPLRVQLQPRSKAWKHAVCRFILSLSDQQLVTALAVLISGIANQKALTVWEFKVVYSLAWFSATSHLTTLDALRTYHESKPVIRHIRVLGMTSVLVLLLYMFSLNMVLVLKSSARTDTQLVQCVFHSEILPIFFNGVNFGEILVSALPLLVMVSGYYTRISELYWGHWIPPSVYNYLFQRRYYFTLKSLAGQDATGNTWPRFLVIDALEARQASARSRRLIKMARTMLQLSPGSNMGFRGFLSLLGKLAYLHVMSVLPSLSDSFFDSFSSITFSFFYGIWQLVFIRWTNQPLLEEDARSMGFGQIMAIFLLVLPPLAAVESYYGTIPYPHRLCAGSVRNTLLTRSRSRLRGKCVVSSPCT